MKTLLFLSVLAALFAAPQPSVAAEDILIADFEADTYGAWKTTGEAFGPGPARGTLPGQMPLSGFKGKGLVNSFYQGDRTTGTLTSPEFTLERHYISFLVGGGKNAEKLAVQLLVGGEVVRRATGPNDRPGGTEALAPESWDVGEFAGRTAVLRIVDEATGGWGHLNVDHIVQTDRKPPGLLRDAKREFTTTRRYLNLPIRNGAPKRKVALRVEDRVVVRNEIELADGPPDWWAPMDVSAWSGRKLTLEVDRLPEDSTALSAVEEGDAVKDGESLYRESLRGQFHFSPRRGWNNDPNGMALFRDEYHLFFQHNPYGWGWGNMHWGHAVSRDLVHWQELGDPLAPDEFGPMFSGSAVVDWHNTSGLGSNGQWPLVLIYTAAGNPTVQCLASSTDGRKFTKYSGNPVLKQITRDNRDPKVIWHEPTQRWVMTLYVETNKVHTIHFLTSTNLKDWTGTCQVEGFFECPDFFELPVDGGNGQKKWVPSARGSDAMVLHDGRERKWVLTAANSEYQIGTFDGATFRPETPKLPGHRGKGFYAAQTFSDIPEKDGRRIQIGWFQTETRGMPFNQSMTIPLELKLTATTDGPRLTFTPVRELEVLRAKTHRFDDITLAPGGTNPLANVQAELVELRAEFEPGDASEVVFTVPGAEIPAEIVYDARKQELIVNTAMIVPGMAGSDSQSVKGNIQRAPAPLRNGWQRLIIYRDRTGLEVFASDGMTYVPMPFSPKGDKRGGNRLPGDFKLTVEARGGPLKVARLQVHELQSAWSSPTPASVERARF